MTVSLVQVPVLMDVVVGMTVVSSTGSAWGTMASRVPPSLWVRVRVGFWAKLAARLVVAVRAKVVSLAVLLPMVTPPRVAR